MDAIRDTRYEIRNIEQAKISEIFLSYQGEGPFAGSRQLFIRFYGCNLSCLYCDTFLESYKSFSRDTLLGKVLDFEDDYNEVSLTGGEPLLYAGFLEEFLPLFRRHRASRIYLETNGTLPDELDTVIEYIDIIAMDFKLPSSAGNPGDLWQAHERCAAIGSRKELIVKTVITDSTTIDDVKRMSGILSGIKGGVLVVLQPVTPVNERVKAPDEEMISYFRGYVRKETGKEVMIMGQMHKCLGIK
ncbi:MAG: 7-carboxy-7-deazaguanine synthase QueE [Candidatus Omnitrophota bacterium]|nr:7-carboxy-7-deazaguanine synthase QueE [Candidatus Omnitrophota bacterium]